MTNSLCSIRSISCFYRNCLSFSHTGVFKKSTPTMSDVYTEFNLFRNLEEILQELKKHKNLEPVQQLLQVYDSAKTKAEQNKEVLNHPLIILEGLDGSGKTSMTRRLGDKLQLTKWKTPPESIRFIRNYFDNNLTLQNAYYSLGNYIAALELSCILPKNPVIMDRYWHSTTAYALAQKVVNNPQNLTLPDFGDAIYKWPGDLLKPTIVIFLNVSEKKRLERHSRRSAELITEQEKLLKNNTKFREDVLQAYKNMREPSVTLINGDGSIEETLSLLLETVNPLFK
ncbi:hypothetical protein ABEB36_008023 [Hypothenemus hampei]|uniref:Thymidylate kinase-like domain-containing protein n=1 Tax=Hypothenemus hampei TaxID=57062 RepID=A0ABD1EKW0_HYPHA